MVQILRAGPRGARRVLALALTGALSTAILTTAVGAPALTAPAGAAAQGPPDAAVVGLAPTPDGAGYWLVGEAGAVGAFGSADDRGSEADTDLNDAVVGMAAAPDGRGYWLVGADGGVFAFGSAAYLGSMAATHLAAPVVGMAAAPDGRGYWLVGADGGVFALGRATYVGRWPVPNPDRLRIGLYGDSLAWEAEPYFSFLAGAAGVDVAQWTFGGTATCDALPAMVADAYLHLRAAVVAFGGNAATPCMAGYPAGTPEFFAKYRADTVEAIRILTGRGTHVYLASAPPASTTAGSENLTVLNRMYGTLASEYPGVTYVDAGRAVTRDGAFAWALPCLSFEPCLGADSTNVVRSPDGVHFCPDGHDPDWRCSVYPSGAFRYGLAMVGPVLRDTGL